MTTELPVPHFHKNNHLISQKKNDDGTIVIQRTSECIELLSGSETRTKNKLVLMDCFYFNFSN